MPTASAIASFVKRPTGDLSGLYWLHIEQVMPPDDTASLGEVAELVDEIYGLDPCEEAGQQDQGAEPDPAAEATAPLTQEELEEIVRNQFRPSLCGMNANGDYATQVKVAISHPGDHYTLRLTNGRIDKTVTVEEPVARTIVVDHADHVDLEFPVVSGGEFTWRGSVYGSGGNMTGPPITWSGRTLAWGQPVSGSLAVSYQTRYDLVDVTVFGLGAGEPGECRAICFYHGLIDEIDLEAPEIDADGLEIYRGRFCGYADLVAGDPSSDQVTCYEDISYVYRCQCSGEEAYQHTEYMVEVPCPPDIRCQAGLDECWSFMGHRTVLGDYVDCGETSGGLDDPAYRTQVCCDQASGLPKCKTFYRKNTGGVPLDPAVEAEYRNRYGDSLKIVAVSPDDGDCGVTKTTVEVHPKNCCDEVEPMTWDSETSAEVVAPGTRVMIGVTGGSPPYHWSVRGQGFTIDGHTMRDGYTDTPYAWLYASSIACGFCSVEVTDGCSVVNDGVRSTIGEWVQIGWPNTTYDCLVSGDNSDFTTFGDGWNWVVLSGKYKLWQQSYMSYWGTAPFQKCGSDPLYTFDPTDTAHYSCISGFELMAAANAVHETDRCFWEDLEWTIRTWYASHHKTTYEWRC